MTCQVCEVIFKLLLGNRYNRGRCLKVRAVSFSFSEDLPVIDNLCKMLGLSPAPSKELSKKEGSVDVVEELLSFLATKALTCFWIVTVEERGSGRARRRPGGRG